MNRAALLFSNADYATALARAVESVGGYKVDVISHIPIRERIAQVLPGNYDLLVADEPIGNGPFAATLARLTRTPLALVFRGWADLTNDHGEWSALRDRSIAARTRFSIGAADGLFVLSDVTRDRLAARYSVDRALTVGRPIDVDYYRSGTTPSTATLTALTVTNFRYEGKFEGVKTVLDGLELAFETHEEFRYRIAGSGRYLPVLREYVSTHPFTERIDVLGRRSDVPDLLSAADLFVYVSYLDAYPTVVLEAQAEGLPVIGGNAVGVPAAVGPAGHVPPATPMGIETAVGRVLGDDAFRATLARRSTARMGVYNAHIARRYTAAFETLIDRDETVSDAVLPSLEPGLQPGPDPEPVVTSDTSAGMASVTASAPETPSVVDSSAASEGGDTL
jgi:glycosyltransferase involved in cell wall biosynthesis